MSERRIFANWLSSAIAASPDYVIRNSQDWSRRLLDLAETLPASYEWLVTNPSSLRQELKKAKPDSDSIGAVYWADMFRSIDAYGVLTVWRGAELLRAAIGLLNDHQVLAPAAISRALLELSVTFLLTANDVADIAKKAAKSPEGAAATSEQLEEIVLNAIYGSRRPGTPKYLKSLPIGQRIEFLSKARGASDLKPTYEYLCDIAHPNTLGNARFAAAMVKKHADGSHTLRLERSAESGHAFEIREKTIWATA